MDNISGNDLTPKQLKLLEGIERGLSLHEAARYAKYSKKTAKNVKWLIRQSPKLTKTILEHHLTTHITLLPKVAKLREDAINLCYDNDGKPNIENIAKLKHIPKEIEHSAGLREEAQQPPNITINIQEVQALWANMLSDTTPKAQDVENAVVVSGDNRAQDGK